VGRRRTVRHLQWRRSRPGGPAWAAQFQHVCDPGEHLFLAWADQASVVKAELEAGKVYDIMVDISMGWVRGNIKLIPLAKDDDRRRVWASSRNASAW